MKEHRKQYTIPIPYEVLYHLYVHQGLTTKDIAQQFHCSQSTVCQRLHDYHIGTHSKHIPIPKEALLHDYAEGKSVTALAEQYQVSPRTIYNRLRQWQVRPTVKAPMPPALPITHILEAYEKGSSATSIAKELHVSPSTIIHLLQMNHVPLRNSTKRILLPIDDICHLYTRNGLSTTQISHIYQVKPSTIASRLRERGLTLRGNKEELPMYAIIAAYQQGTPLQVLAETYHTKYHTIRNMLIRNGVYQKARRIRDCTYDIQSLHLTERLSVADIATRYACHPETIRRIIKDAKKKNKSAHSYPC